MPTEIRRNNLDSLCARMQEPRRFLQVVAGPRQVGKTTMVRQALEALGQQPGKAIAQHSVSADNPGLVGASWLRSQWETARSLAAQGHQQRRLADESGAKAGPVAPRVRSGLPVQWSRVELPKNDGAAKRRR